MMKWMLTILMLLCCLTGPFLAEGAHFSGERSNGSRPALAVVNGQVYGLSGHEGALAAFTPTVPRCRAFLRFAGRTGCNSPQIQVY